MITPKVKGTRVVFGPVRLSYTHLLSKYAFEGDNGDGKYSTNILIPKNETETIDAIRAAIATAQKEAKIGKWKNKPGTPGKTDPLFDGEGRDDIYNGHYYLNAKSNNRPQVVDRDMQPITNEDEVYSGMWAYVSVSFYGYSIGGNGIACAINSVRKYKDDERLGGGPSAAEDFAGIDDDDL